MVNLRASSSPAALVRKPAPSARVQPASSSKGGALGGIIFVNGDVLIAGISPVAGRDECVHDQFALFFFREQRINGLDQVILVCAVGKSLAHFKIAEDGVRRSIGSGGNGSFSRHNRSFGCDGGGFGCNSGGFSPERRRQKGSCWQQPTNPKRRTNGFVTCFFLLQRRNIGVIFRRKINVADHMYLLSKHLL